MSLDPTNLLFLPDTDLTESEVRSAIVNKQCVALQATCYPGFIHDEYKNWEVICSVPTSYQSFQENVTYLQSTPTLVKQYFVGYLRHGYTKKYYKKKGTGPTKLAERHTKLMKNQKESEIR
eukprot:UN04652